MGESIRLFQIKSVLRPLAFALLICVMAFQIVAPVIAAPSVASMPEHMMAMDHGKMAHSGGSGIDHDMSEMNAHHQDAAHCMSFMCCFHETSAPFKLLASDVLLPSDMGIEQAMILPSHSQISKDRPPQAL